MKPTLALLLPLLLAPAAYAWQGEAQHGPLDFDPYKLHEETMRNSTERRAASREALRVEPDQPEAHTILLPTSRIITCITSPWGNSYTTICN